MFTEMGGEPQAVALTLYTDAHVIQATYRTRQRRITDILNGADDGFLVVRDVTFEELGVGGDAVRAGHAQVNLASILFAVTSDVVEALPELRTAKVPEQAFVSIPPFSLVGRIHLLPNRALDESLHELTGRFLPVTEATFWSDRLGVPRRTAAMVAINHARAQILAAHDGPGAG